MGIGERRERGRGEFASYIYMYGFTNIRVSCSMLYETFDWGVRGMMGCVHNSFPGRALHKVERASRSDRFGTPGVREVQRLRLLVFFFSVVQLYAVVEASCLPGRGC